MNTIGDNTPDNFKIALQKTKDKLLTETNGTRIPNTNFWNEWTVGSCFEPDTVIGMAYQNAIREVLIHNN